MQIIVQNRTKTKLPPLPVQDLCRVAQRLLKLPPSTEATLVFTSDSAIRELNRRTRGVNKTTGVLSFPLHIKRPFSVDPDGVLRLGDIIISLPAARREARKRNISLQTELSELIVHGLLHLAGFSHETPQAASRMYRMAESILASS